MTDKLPKNPKDRKPAQNFVGIDPDRKGYKAGAEGGRMLEPAGTYDKAACEKFIHLDDHPGGCGIVLGRDRPHSKKSGYMGPGDTQAFAIRLTAGFGACLTGSPDKTKPWPKDKAGNNLIKGYWPDLNYGGTKDNDGNLPKLYFNPSNKLDGATIYLSQKSDIDEDFNCAGGTIGKITGGSAAVMKADSVRVISRDGGIKFIANTDKFHSGGGRIHTVQGIDFIVNNDESKLQPLVKGDDLNEFLKMIRRWLNEVLVQLHIVTLSQMDLNTAIATHRHVMPGPTLTPIPDPAKMGAPYTVTEYMLAGLAPAPEMDPVVATAPSGLLATSVGRFNATQAQATIPNLLLISQTLDGMERDYLNPIGPNYILSRNVNTT